MLSILRAEFRRLTTHRGVHVLLLFAATFYLVDVVVKTAYVLNEPRERALEVFVESFNFPISLFTAVSTSFVLFLFLWPAITAKLIGGDYESDTWKMILPRTPERWRLLSGKALVLVVLIVVLVLLDFVFLNIGALIAASQHDIPFLSAPFVSVEHHHKEVAAEFLGFVLWYSSVGVLFTVVSRSVFTGAFATLSFYFVCVFIRIYSPEMLAILFAPSHFSNLIPPEESAVVFAGGRRLHISPALSWLAVFLHVVGNLFFSYLWIGKQDFDSAS